MLCIVLAAGYATRMFPLTENFPKPLLKVQGKPILNWLLEDIDAIAAIEQLVVITNHRFIGHFNEWADKQCFNKPLVVLDDGSTQNADRVGAVKDITLAHEAAGKAKDALVIAGDNLLTFSLREFVDYYRQVHTSCIMYHQEPDIARCRRTGIITLDAKGFVTGFEEKPAEPKSNLAVPPFYVYTALDLHLIPQAIAEGCTADAPGSFAAWLSGKRAVHAWKMTGKRYDIGNIPDYEAIEAGYKNVKM